MPARPSEPRKIAVRGWAALLITAVALGGCGYHLVRTGQPLGADIGRVAVQPLRNDSYEPGLEVMVSDALRREFLRRGGVQLVDDPTRADLVLGGAVRPLDIRASAISAVTAALEYQVEMEIELSAQRGDGSVLTLDPPIFREWELYLASADVEAERKNRKEALRRLASVLAVRVHDALVTKLSP